MAVDSTEKRFSMLNFGDGNNWHLLPQADGTIDLDDRQHLLDCYSGIVFDGGVAPTAAQRIRGFTRNVGRLMNP